MKRRLNSLFQRRNMIAHQSDRRHAGCAKRTHFREVVEDFIADVEKIVAAGGEGNRKKARSLGMFCRNWHVQMREDVIY